MQACANLASPHRERLQKVGIVAAQLLGFIAASAVLGAMTGAIGGAILKANPNGDVDIITDSAKVCATGTSVVTLPAALIMKAFIHWQYHSEPASHCQEKVRPALFYGCFPPLMMVLASIIGKWALGDRTQLSMPETILTALIGGFISTTSGACLVLCCALCCGSCLTRPRFSNQRTETAPLAIYIDDSDSDSASAAL